MDDTSGDATRSVPGPPHRMARSGTAIKLTVMVVVVGILANVAYEAALRFVRATTLDPEPSASIAPVPEFSAVFVIVLENKTVEQIVGRADAPYLNSLIDRFGLATSYQAVGHPSQPNYLALVSGSTQGIADNDPHDVTAATLFDQLESAGRSWRIYAENVPGGCFTGATSSDGRDGSGTYGRKHNPAISFTDIQGSPARCANILDLTSFDPQAADLEFIVPNLCHDMHDCPVSDGDRWLSTVVPRILGSEAFRRGGALFITFDESADSEPKNQVAMIVAGPTVVPGVRSDTPHSHYSLLRTVQAAWGLDCLAASCQANTLGEFFR